MTLEHGLGRPRPRVLLAFDQHIHDDLLGPDNVARLDAKFDWFWLRLEGGERQGANDDPAAIEALEGAIGDIEALVVCSGSPMIDARILEHASKLRIVGEMLGDRFARRLDVESLRAAGVRVVDSTNGGSYPVAEWALALMLVSVWNAGEQFRHLIANEPYVRPRTDFGYVHSELTGRKVGLIGCGYIARRLIEFLRPFGCDIRVYDPYIPKEIPDMLGVLLTSLDYVLSESDVVVSLVPLTPATRGMLGKREFDLLPSGCVFVNVSRGAIVDSEALIARLRRGDIVAGLDVFDPEPIPVDSPIRQLQNVFITPHIAGSGARVWPRLASLMIDELERFFAGHETLYDLSPRALANRRGDRPDTR
jgi:phosphoglycerate dehydrogenase-like enzyme